MRRLFKTRTKGGILHELSAQQEATVIAKINQDRGTDFKTMREVDRYFARHPKLRAEYELIIPESALLSAMSKALGVDFKTVEDITKYLNENPEARERLERGP